MTQIFDLIERKVIMRARPEPAPIVRQRLADAAAGLSRTGDLAIHTEIANEAITRFTGVLYERDADGYSANVDLMTSRILLPAPWGSNGWKSWGLRHWEAIVLRAVMLERSADIKRPALYLFNPDRRYWALNLSDYPALAQATFFFGRGAITVKEWRRAADAYRLSEAARKRAADARQRAQARR